MLRRLIGEDIELRTFLAPSLGLVRVDPGQLGQVILNLAVNARDVMPTGGKLTFETANVELDESYTRERLAVHPGPYVMLAVNDTGHGMDRETQAHIFEPFFTTKGRGKGTGLGLSTTFGIAKQSGGHIAVYSEPGQGATFKVYVPLAEEATAPAGEKATQRAIRTGSETILVVEDEAALRHLTRSILEGAGYQMLEADSADAALLLFEQHEGPIQLLWKTCLSPRTRPKST
jgi:CheY-like chemotaxis protein